MSLDLLIAAASKRPNGMVLSASAEGNEDAIAEGIRMFLGRDDCPAELGARVKELMEHQYPIAVRTYAFGTRNGIPARAVQVDDCTFVYASTSTGADPVIVDVYFTEEVYAREDV